ncbi:MAG: hypothetical protein Q9197_000510 [Variospora fuerteventurae]
MSLHRISSKAWGNLSKIRPLTPPPTLSTCDELSEAEGALHEERAFFTPAQDVQPLLSASLLARPLAIEVQGLDDETQQPIDFYQPAVRRFRQKKLSAPIKQLNSLRRPLVIDPVDTVLVWKGLTLSDCETLILVQKHVKACLEQLLEDQFIAFKARLRSDGQSSLEDCLAMPEPFETVIPCQFYFTRIELTEAVSEALEKTISRRNANESRPFNDLLRLYLWSRDCLFDLPNASGYTALNGQFRCLMDSGACCPSSSAIEALCTPDHLSFEGLDVLPQEGTQIIIKPHYQANAPRRPGDPFTLITYSLESNHPWLHWCDQAGAFRGHVPRFSRNPSGNGALGQFQRLGSHGLHAAVHNVTIEVKASVVISYRGSGICLERTIRVRISLRVLPTSLHSSQKQFQYQPAISSEGHISSQFQSQHLHAERDSPCPQDNVDTDATHARVQSREKRTARMTPSLSAPLGASKLGSSVRKTSSRPSDSSTKAQDSNPLSANLESGFQGHSNGHAPPSWGKKQELSPSRVVSNVSGIQLEPLALVPLNPDDPVLRERTPCNFYNNKGRVEGSVTCNEKHLEQTKAVDVRYTPRTLKTRIAGPGTVDSTGPPRGSRPESYVSLTGSPRAYPSSRHAKSFATIKAPPHKQGPKSDAYRFITRSAGKRKIRSAQSFHSSLKGRQDRCSKVSSLDEEPVIILDLREEEFSHHQAQRGTVASSPPGTGSFANPSDPGPQSDRTASGSLTTSDRPQTVVFFNRFASLRDLLSGSDPGPSSICGTSNNGELELPLDATAQNPSEQVKAADPNITMKFCRRNNFYSRAPFNEANSHEDDPCTSNCNSGDKASRLPLFGSFMVTKTRAPPIDGLPSLSSSILPPNSTCSAAGFDHGSELEQRAAWRVSTSKEAVEACREKCLSNHERSQMFEALKRSLPPEPTREDIVAAYSMDSVSEVDTDTDMEANSTIGSGFDSGVDWVEDSEEK